MVQGRRPGEELAIDLGLKGAEPLVNRLAERLAGQGRAAPPFRPGARESLLPRILGAGLVLAMALGNLLIADLYVLAAVGLATALGILFYNSGYGSAEPDETGLVFRHGFMRVRIEYKYISAIWLRRMALIRGMKCRYVMVPVVEEALAGPRTLAVAPEAAFPLYFFLRSRMAEAEAGGGLP